MRVIDTIREMQSWSDAQRIDRQRIVLVPTMGFLHEGHLNLVREGGRNGSRLVVSIFVNPSQFGPGEDFAAYPRDLERDRQLLESASVDILFHPSVAEMYPENFSTYVDVERLSSVLCGIFRPGHFRGVATVVTKLFHIVRPHVAIFGAKDYQQLQIVRRLVRDLDFDMEIVSHPIMRERDGLAMSSRNAYLSPDERRAALSLSRSLEQAKAMVRGGETQRRPIVDKVRSVIEREPLARVEYVSLCDPFTLEEIEQFTDTAVLALAVRIGKARLIDNTALKA